MAFAQMQEEGKLWAQLNVPFTINLNTALMYLLLLPDPR